MMKKLFRISAGFIVFCLVFSPGVYAQHAGSGLSSLRGHTPIDEEAAKPSMKKWAKDGEPIARDYVQQPPLIPHTTKGYKINRKFNKCLTCHSWANYRDAGATKISQTHFSDRENNVLANVAARRYFCTQCHVPQVNIRPLVDNTFEALKTIKRVK